MLTVCAVGPEVEIVFILFQFPGIFVHTIVARGLGVPFSGFLALLIKEFRRWLEDDFVNVQEKNKESKL